MKIEVNISKIKFLIVIIAVLIFAGGIFVYAYNYPKYVTSGTPTGPYKNVTDAQKFGHTADETVVNYKGSVMTVQSAFDLVSTQGLGDLSIITCYHWKGPLADNYIPGIIPVGKKVIFYTLTGFLDADGCSHKVYLNSATPPTELDCDAGTGVSNCMTTGMAVLVSTS